MDRREARGRGEEGSLRGLRDRPGQRGAPQGQSVHGERQDVPVLHPGAAENKERVRAGRHGVHAVQGPAAHADFRQREGIRRTRENRRRAGSRLLLRASVPLVGAGSEREHERAYPPVPAEGNIVRGLDQGGGEADRVETEQQAEKKAWIFDSARVYFETGQKDLLDDLNPPLGGEVEKS